MGFACGWVWIMGYCRPMGYGMQFPMNQVGGQLDLWDIRGYGLSEVWVMRGSTVLFLGCHMFSVFSRQDISIGVDRRDRVQVM